MRHPSPLPVQLETAPFHVSAADAVGVTRERLRSSDLLAPFKAVRVPKALLEAADDDRKFEILCDAYQAKLPQGWFFSFATAARILGIPLPQRLERPEVHVTAPRRGVRPRGRHVKGHSAVGAKLGHFFGRVVRDPAELWCELASILNLDELIAAGDRLLSEYPVMLTTRRRLEAAVAAHGAGRGARMLREALPLLRDNVWSPRETWLRLVLLRAGLPEPERNRRIHGRGGRLIAIGDLVYPQFGIVIEYEGERWHADPWSVIDSDRYTALSIQGWTIVRIRKHHTAADAEQLVREALIARGWRG